MTPLLHRNNSSWCTEYPDTSPVCWLCSSSRLLLSTGFTHADGATSCQGDLSPQAFTQLVCCGAYFAQGSCKSFNTMLSQHTGIRGRPGYRESHLFPSGLGWLPWLSPRKHSSHSLLRYKQTHGCGLQCPSVGSLSLWYRYCLLI